MKKLFLLFLFILFSLNSYSIYDSNNNKSIYELINPYKSTSIGYTTDYSIGITNSTSPRRVKGYDANGDSINTTGNAGNPNPMWQDGYDYYYWNGHWYRKQGNTWNEWRTLLDWGFALWDWRSGSPGTNNPTQYYEHPQVPLDNDLAILSLLLFIYFIIKLCKLRIISSISLISASTVLKD